MASDKGYGLRCHQSAASGGASDRVLARAGLRHPNRAHDRTTGERASLFDEISPEFQAVGLWYANFEKTSDEEVIESLEQAGREAEDKTEL